MIPVDTYRVMSRVYARLGRIYSGGEIEACKRAFLDDLRPGQRALFVGAGIGTDAIESARRGVNVTAVDISPAMIEQIRNRLPSARDVELVCANIYDLDRYGHYDWVFANFFLNVFPDKELPRLLDHLKRFLSQDGRLVVGDFAPPSSRWWERVLQEIHYGLPLSVFWLVTRTPLHRLHDYRAHYRNAGLRLLETRRFRALHLGPHWYTAHVLQR